MSAPMVNHVLVNKSHHFPIQSAIRLLLKTHSLSRQTIHFGKACSSHTVGKQTVTNKDSGERNKHINEINHEGDFYGVTEFYDSIPPRTNPSSSLEEGELRKKYNVPLQKDPGKYESVVVPYGMVRLDVGVAEQFKRSELEENKVSRRKRDRQKNRSERNRNSQGSKNVSKTYQKDNNYENYSSYQNDDILYSSRKVSGTKSRNYSEKTSYSKSEETLLTYGENMRWGEEDSSYTINTENEKSTMAKQQDSNYFDEVYFGSHNIRTAETRSLRGKSFKASHNENNVSDMKDKGRQSNDENLNYFDQDYFGSLIKDTSTQTVERNFEKFPKEENNFIDGQYFEQVLSPESGRLDVSQNGSYRSNRDKHMNSPKSEAFITGNDTNNHGNTSNVLDNDTNTHGNTSNVLDNDTVVSFKDSEVNFIDSQYFGESQHSNLKSPISDPVYVQENGLLEIFSDNNSDLRSDRKRNRGKKSEKAKQEEHPKKKISDWIENQTVSTQPRLGENLMAPTEENCVSKKSMQMNSVHMVEKHEKLTDHSALYKPATGKQSKPLTTAEEAARKIREELNKPDQEESSTKERRAESKILRKSKDVRAALDMMTSSEVAKLLYESIVYDRDDIVALSKPYGLASQDGPGMHVSIAQCLEKLKTHVDPDIQKLFLINHLDKDMTGVVLMAKTEEMAFRLKKAFTAKQVIMKYFLVTKGVPKLEEGIIDIPMTEGMVNKKYRMVLRPEGFAKQKSTLKAETQYKVLSSTLCSAFVECTPFTSVKHQIRAHMFYGLNTPIIGDHKYSYIEKIAPQKLFPEMLHQLRIRQAEVRHLPLHLHARSLIIPEFLEGRNLNIKCRVPRFFVETMKKLKLNYKDFL